MKLTDFIRLILSEIPLFSNLDHSARAEMQVSSAGETTRPDLPSFLWIIAEGTGPWVGCYREPLVREAVVANGSPRPAFDVLWREIETACSAANEAFSAIETFDVGAAPLDPKTSRLTRPSTRRFCLRSTLVTRGFLPASKLFPSVYK